jgi:hypothetical protein
MRRSISLAPLRNAPPLAFEYDVETGAISGRDAVLVGDFIASAENVRHVSIDPPPRSYKLGPSPHSIADLAAIFGRFYVLPDWLEAERPRGGPEPEPEDGEIEPIY